LASLKNNLPKAGAYQFWQVNFGVPRIPRVPKAGALGFPGFPGALGFPEIETYNTKNYDNVHSSKTSHEKQSRYDRVLRDQAGVCHLRKYGLPPPPDGRKG